MAQLDSTIGVVHWAALQVLGDGEGLHIVVPADFEQYHEPYLQSVLPSRLSSIIADERVKVEARGGECNANGWEKPGEIVVSLVSEPWPDVDALRHALEAALVEAGEVEAAQRKRAHELRQLLLTAEARPSQLAEGAS
jgi:hypothetical protein